MEIEDIYKLLNVDKLDESQQVTIKEKLDDIIDIKARERATVILDEEKKTLVEEYEVKFEDYKKDITSKFSNFVDSVLDEELKIPEKVLKYAKLGEDYNELIESFKVKLAVSEGVLDEEVKRLLKEAKEEIENKNKELNKLTAEKLELVEDAKEMASHIYLRKKCDGLTESQRTKIISLLGDIKNVAEIDKKFKIVMEDLEPGTETPPAEATTNANVCPSCGAVATPKGEETIIDCPKCGAKMKDVADVDSAEENGQGVVEVPPVQEEDGTARTPENASQDDSTTTIPESTSYVDQNKASWLKILREGKL